MSSLPGGQEASVPEALILVQESFLVIAEGGRSVGKKIRGIAIISCSFSFLSLSSSILEMFLFPLVG